jgi:3D (Asp-Asp-Asp) domain-containing protein
VKSLLVGAAAVGLISNAADAETRRRPTQYTFKATAYSVEGITKSGGQTRFGIVAADPKVLPLGTRIRVSGAGRYSGTYIVTDTGARIDGREIDIYLPSDAAAKEFGEKRVTVRVLKWGDGDVRPGEQPRPEASRRR